MVARLLLLYAAIAQTTSTSFDVRSKLRLAAASSCRAFRRVAHNTFLLRHRCLVSDLLILLLIDLRQVVDLVLQQLDVLLKTLITGLVLISILVELELLLELLVLVSEIL